VIHLIISAFALTGAAYLVDGIDMTGGYLDVLFVALVFGLVNAPVKPIVFFFSPPFLFFTLGLCYLVINGVMLLLTAELADNFLVQGIWPAVVGSLVIAIISMMLSVLLKDKKKK
jgi:putative membrane protein